MPSATGRREPDAGGRGFRLGYRPELDGLRGLAVLAVMAYHCELRRFLPGGFLGVDVFFVLSGFLITALLLREHQQTGRIHLPRFYLRRARRLFPALFLMLAVCWIWAVVRTKPARAAVIHRAALLTACHVANAASWWSLPMDCLGHAWSLSLEEQFYLVWPILLAVLLRCGVRRRRIALLAALGLSASALVRAGLWFSPWPAGAAAAATSLMARADALLAGCLVGLLVAAGRRTSSPRSRRMLQTAAGVSVAVLLLFGMLANQQAAFLYLGGFTVVAAAAAVVTAALAAAPPWPLSRLLSAPPLVGIGRISYGLYLWHFPLLSLAPKLIHSCIPAMHRLPEWDAPLAYLLALGAALLSYYAVERPFLRGKARLASGCHFGGAGLSGGRMARNHSLDVSADPLSVTRSLSAAASPSCAARRSSSFISSGFFGPLKRSCGPSTSSTTV
ncbi:MAG TPA: acyltransferase [Gemmataceae bacterium]|nr:acyltransferase [Gemmataceae bacterium]